MEKNWQLVIALYAAVISTLVLIWRLIEFYFEKAGRIRVRLKYITQIPVSFSYELGVPVLYLSVIITNFSNHRRSIERPSFQTDIMMENKNKFSFIDFTDSTHYPISLDPGERREINYNKITIDEKFNKIGVKKIRVFIEDTLDKSYHSNWISIYPPH